jgi:hypothetical protein
LTPAINWIKQRGGIALRELDKVREFNKGVEGEAMSEALEKIRADHKHFEERFDLIRQSPSIRAEWMATLAKDRVRLAEALDTVRLHSDDKAMRLLAHRVLREVAGDVQE